QEQLAAQLGVGQLHVARLEAGRHTPTIPTLVRLAQRLEVTFRVDVTPAGARLAPVEPDV
ncbi:MAG: helix-turn-helix domain-containing protein, partial [Chloroflexota bacterium]|nr:helix-turn-helix domain-containing protein [Chloroflexota bacterium]